MKTKYTQGPWKAVYGKPQDRMPVSIYAKESDEFSNRPLAMVEPAGTDFSLANANLIAAAPELLEALLRLVAVCHGADDSEAAALEQAMYAISKAEAERGSQ